MECLKQDVSDRLSKLPQKDQKAIVEDLNSYADKVVSVFERHNN